MASIAGLRQLPASAPVVQKALVCLEKVDFSVTALKHILLSDHAVAARILRLANSAYFGFRSEVQTVSHAVVLLGQTRIQTLLRRMLADRLMVELGHGRPAATPIRRLSLATATASSMLAQWLNFGDLEEMLLAGLLHNIGELFVFSQFPKEHDQITKAEDRCQAARAILGITMGRAGRLLLEHWEFPALYPVVAEFCEEPLSPECPPALGRAVALVHAARKVAAAYLAGADPAAMAQRPHPGVMEILRLDDRVLMEVYQALPERMSIEQPQAN